MAEIRPKNLPSVSSPVAGDRLLLDGTTARSILVTDFLASIGFSVHGADIASAATVNLETATGDLVDVTGTTTITAITLSDGHERTVRFTGALTLTNGASLVLPGAANITTAAGDFAVFRGYAAGVVRCVDFTRAASIPLQSTSSLAELSDKKSAIDNLSVNGADIASAATINLETATGNCVDVTGTTTITAITLSAGHERRVRFAGILTLTNGASLILPGGGNIITAAGDFATFRGYAAGVVRLVNYQVFNLAEEITSLVTAASPVALTNNVDTLWNTVVIPRAGLWEVGGNVGVLGTSGTPVLTHMHSDHSVGGGSVQTSPGNGTTVAQHVTTNQQNLWILAGGNRRYRTTGSTTINFRVIGEFSGGNIGAYGYSWARRVAP